MPIVIIQGKIEREKHVHYEVDSSLEPVGQGGMGRVMRGIQVDEKTGVTRDVAIKFMFDDLPPESIEHARREASIHLRNDNLIEMLGFIETEEKNAIGETIKHYQVVSEYLHCISLSDVLNGKCKDKDGEDIPYAVKLLQEYRTDSELFAKRIVKEVLNGLLALHDAGYIHRDVDPSNIVLTSDEHIKLIDLGIAKQIGKLTTHDKPLTVAGRFIGKPEYAAPELARGDIKHQNQTTDIYAVGILLYQLITSHTPFEGTMVDVLDKQIHEKIDLKPIKDKGLREIIRIATAKDQKKRYQSVAQMRVAIENLNVKYPWWEAHKKKIIVSVGAIIISLLVITGFLMIHRPKPLPQKTLEETYKENVVLLSMENTDSVRKGLAIMDSLGRKNYVPALYEIAFTYGWYSDPASLKRKNILKVRVYDNPKDNSCFLPVQDKYTDIAVANLQKITEIGDSSFAKINAQSTYRLACYYIKSNKRFNKDVQKGRQLLLISRNWAQMANDILLIKNIDNSLETFHDNKK